MEENRRKETKVGCSLAEADNGYFRLPDGKTADFDIIKSGAVVCTLALTPDKKVILVRQFRPGPKNQ